MKLKTVKNRPVRMGVVGCGVVSGYGHIPAIDQCELAELVGFADPDPERRQEQADKYGKPAFASFEEMVKEVELDAVSIPTHPGIKLDLIKIAAENGLHAFCEKPLTDTVEQAEELIRVMDEAGLFVGMAFVYRGKDIVQRMMELVREGTIGEVRAVLIENMWDYHGLRSDGWGGHYVGRRHRALKNLGTLDCGVHDLDLARYMSGGDYGDIRAIGAIVEKENVFPDHMIIQSKMSNGVLVSVEESGVWGYTAKETPRYEQSYRMLGSDGVLSTSVGLGGEVGQLYIVSGEKQWTEDIDSGKAWLPTYRQFFQTILGDEIDHRFIANGHDALKNMIAARDIVDQIMDGM